MQQGLIFFMFQDICIHPNKVRQMELHFSFFIALKNVFVICKASDKDKKSKAY